MTENTPETTENTQINQENTQNVNQIEVESPVINEQTTEKLTKLTKRQKIGGRKPKLTEKNIKEAIDGCLGNYSTIAQRLNVSRSAITQFFNKHPELKQLADNDEEKIKDIVQNHIHVALKNGDSQYIKWFADSKMRDRGYGQKTQIEANVHQDVWKEGRELLNLMVKYESEESKKRLKELVWKKSGDIND